MKEKTLQRLLDFDRCALTDQRGLVVGIDEAGRGPLAGPVVAGAVILKSNCPLAGLNDSKKLTAKKRLKLYRLICLHARVGIGVVGPKIIDQINIYQATRLAMKKALLALNVTPDLMLIDGNLELDLPIKQKAIIKGDSKSASIAAASVIAKVFRDYWMEKLSEIYPTYQFAKHKGYPTKTHIEALNEAGVSPEHRMSFGPVRRCHNTVKSV